MCVKERERGRERGGERERERESTELAFLVSEARASQPN